MAAAKKTTKSTAKKKATAKKTVKKATTKKTAAKKTATKKTATKKAPVKKTAAKKTATKKTASTKKATAKKATPAKKAATKKAPAKKTATSKTTTKKATKTSAKAVNTKKVTAPKPQKINVGQAPKKKTLAASIPVPTQMPPRDAAPIENNLTESDETAASDAKGTFKVNDQIVYPAHGVGRIVELERQEVAGIAIELFVIDFDQEKMKLRVPTSKASSAGMRALSDNKTIKNAVELLKGRARIKRTMWSRRAQEYDAKINSGDIKLVAEVVRDLYRAENQPEQSYSERQLFEAALDRMARELAAVREVDLGKAIEEIEASLHKKAPQ